MWIFVSTTIVDERSESLSTLISLFFFCLFNLFVLCFCSENVFSHGGEYYVHFDSIKTLDLVMIDSAIIDVWALLLNKKEFLTNSKEAPHSYRFSSQHSVSFIVIYEL